MRRWSFVVGLKTEALLAIFRGAVAIVQFKALNRKEREEMAAKFAKKVALGWQLVLLLLDIDKQYTISFRYILGERT